MLPEFAREDAQAPVVLEIFTDKANDIKVLKGFRRLIHQDAPAEKMVEQIKSNPVVQQFVHTEVGQSVKNTIKKGLKKFF